MNHTDLEPARLRGTGRTTRQINDAPQGAYYVWISSAIHYPRALARHLGRDDLMFVSPDWLERADNYRGRRGLKVVVDHACWLSPGAREGFHYICMRNSFDEAKAPTGD